MAVEFSEDAPWRVTERAQRLLGLRVDGVWGPNTQAAYESTNTAVRAEIDRLMRVENLSPYSVGRVTTTVRRKDPSFRNRKTAAYPLASSYKVEKSVNPETIARAKSNRDRLLANRAEMIKLTKKIASEEGVPERTALVITRLESNFDPNAVSPTGFKGMMQLGTPAMTDAYNLDKSKVDWTPAGRNKYGPLFKMTDPFNAEQNLRVGCRYIRVCAKQLRVPLTDIATLYMGFNIGYGGAKLVIAGKPEAVATEIRANPAYAKNGLANYRSTLTAAVNSALV